MRGQTAPNYLVTKPDEMSRDRFKQEVALIVIDRIMEAIGHQVRDRFHDTSVEALTKSLSQFEECRGRVIGGVAEAIADAAATAMGPSLPDRGEE